MESVEYCYMIYIGGNQTIRANFKNNNLLTRKDEQPINNLKCLFERKSLKTVSAIKSILDYRGSILRQA